MNEIWVVETNFVGNGVHAMSIAKNMGYRTRFLTQDIAAYRSCRLDPCEYADDVMIVNTADPVEMFRHTLSEKPAAVLAYDDFALLPAAILARNHNLCSEGKLRGLFNAKFKDLTRKLCEPLGNSVPYFLLRGEENIVYNPVGYPCVVKPVDNSGSMNVRVCQNQSEFIEALSRVRSHILSEDTNVEYGIVETYISGPEFSAEFVFDCEQDDWVLLGYVRKIVSSPPFCVELGHVCPYYFDGEIALNVESQLRDCLNAIGLRETLAHVEFKMVEDKPILIEINARPAGGMIAELFKISYGVDLVEYHIKSNMKLPIQYNKSSLSTITSAIWYITHKHPGKILAVEYQGEAYDKRICQVYVKDMPLQIQGLTSGDDRLGYVIAVGESTDEPLGLAKRVVDSFKIVSM